jgi:hypothetical protein
MVAVNLKQCIKTLSQQQQFDYERYVGKGREEKCFGIF